MLSEQEKHTYVQAPWSAIVPLKVFKEVQTKLEYNSQRTRKRLINADYYPYILTPFVYCGDCGIALRGAGGTGHKGGQKFKFTYYKHPNASSKDCLFISVSAPRLEQVVIKRLNELKKDKQLLDEMAERLKKDISGSVSNVSEVIQKQEKEAQNIDVKIQNLVRTLEELPSGASGASIHSRIFELEKQRDQISESLQKLKDEKSHKSNVIDVSPLFKMLQAIRRDFSELTLNEQRGILAEIVDHIEVFSDKIEIFYVTGSKDIAKMDINEILGREASESSGNRWARVRPSERMVDPTGIEPATSTMPL